MFESDSIASAVDEATPYADHQKRNQLNLSSFSKNYDASSFSQVYDASKSAASDNLSIS